MAIPATPTIWATQFQVLQDRTLDSDSIIFSRMPSGSKATLESALHLRVLWDSDCPQHATPGHIWWPDHPLFRDKSLKGKGQATWETQVTIPIQITSPLSPPMLLSPTLSATQKALLYLCAFVKKGEKKDEKKAVQTPQWPQPNQLIAIQDEVELSCFISFARHLAQINLQPGQEKNQKRLERPQIDVFKPNSPAIRSRKLRSFGNSIPNIPLTISRWRPTSQENVNIGQITSLDDNDDDDNEDDDDDDDSDYDSAHSRDSTIEDSLMQATLIAAYEQTTVITLLSLLSVLEGLSSTPDEILISAASPPWNFMDNGQGDPMNPGRRTKIWSATADGMISRNGEIVASLEAKPSKRDWKVKYQEATELGALIREMDTSSDQKKRFHRWAISINGNQLTLLLASWNQSYLEYLEEIAVLQLEQGSKSQGRKANAKDNIALRIAGLSLEAGPSGAFLPHTPHGKQFQPQPQPQPRVKPTKPPISQTRPKRKGLLSTSTNQQTSTISPPPQDPNITPSSTKSEDNTAERFLEIKEIGPFNLWDADDLRTFFRLFEYLINCDLDKCCAL